MKEVDAVKKTNFLVEGFLKYLEEDMNASKKLHYKIKYGELSPEDEELLNYAYSKWIADQEAQMIFMGD